MKKPYETDQITEPRTLEKRVYKKTERKIRNQRIALLAGTLLLGLGLFAYFNRDTGNHANVLATGTIETLTQFATETSSLPPIDDPDALAEFFTPTPSPSPTLPPPTPSPTSIVEVTPTPNITSTETTPTWKRNESEPLESHTPPKHARYFTLQPHAEYLELSVESGNSQFSSESGYLLVFDPTEPNPENREQWLIGIPNEDGTYTYNLPVKEVTFIVNGEEVTILQTVVQIWNGDRENFGQAPKGTSFIVNGIPYYSDFTDVQNDLLKDVFFSISYPQSLVENSPINSD